MRFRVTIPGQPVSLDAAYRTGLVPVKRKGVAVLNDDGTPRKIHRPVLTRDAALWRDAVQTLVQCARPSRWRPAGQLRVLVDLHLADDMDASNTEKLISDGIKRAIEYDDIHFLVCFRSKEAGLPLRDARVDLTIDDDIRCPCG